MNQLIVSAIEKAKDPSFREWRYFRELSSGEMSWERFVASQRQFAHAVNFFARPMAVLAARLPNSAWRWAVIENIAEEHGEGDLQQSHEATFAKFLDAFGVTIASPDAPVTAFNNALLGTASFEPIAVGVGMFGVIEDLFSEISRHIAAEVIRHGWLDEPDLAHYSTHAILDERHSDDFYRVLDAIDQPEDAAHGVALGAYLFRSLYDAL